jgi:hypothetical protein
VAVHLPQLQLSAPELRSIECGWRLVSDAFPLGGRRETSALDLTATQGRKLPIAWLDCPRLESASLFARDMFRAAAAPDFSSNWSQSLRTLRLSLPNESAVTGPIVRYLLLSLPALERLLCDCNRFAITCPALVPHCSSLRPLACWLAD